MNKEHLPIGTLLLPNEYQIANPSPTWGLILQIKDDLWGFNYKVHLSNGITKWIGDDVIRDLFTPCKPPSGDDMV